jgi:hypothetical protein
MGYRFILYLSHIYKNNKKDHITNRSSGQFTRAGFRIRSNRPVRPAAELKRYVE